ncbi:SH2 domain-containing protein 4B isoform X3 [Biomphalaria pfeifferi]|uniref:SH2 domain-containing protein 4B isoform X3 n=1 Tax=Biomphalaria pfeifferi TaxID=112525 RepID=A0AAD8B5L9_BIOPF|nr:SH2 domain-containing protein 4B isoform X3 [Biomphalaria pfeifferi]
MLQQILDQMYIDPELMAELSEDQKQILFYKMRQEQIRRWKIHEEQMEVEDKNPTGKKKVQFMKARDGSDWVWVMGEHPNDKSIEQILQEEALLTAAKLAEAEAKVLREKEEAELQKRLEEERQRLQKEKEERENEMKRQQEEAALYQSIKEARLALERMELEKKRQEEEEKKRLAEIEEKEKEAKRRSREFSDLMREKRSSEIYTSLLKKRESMEKLAEENQSEVETNWQEQEKKAKEAELQMREKARQARTEYRESLRRSMNILQATQFLQNSTKPAPPNNKPPLPPKKHLIVTSAPGITNKKPRPLRPKNREQVVSWFQKDEKQKGSGLDPKTGKVAEWFHGIINRSEAEAILQDKKSGSFLIRVSERVWGYTLSLKETSGLKHFLIDASDLGYQFFGADQTIHDSLASLVLFHKDNPITFVSLP